MPVVVAGTLAALARTLLALDRAEEARAAAERAVALYQDHSDHQDHPHHPAARDRSDGLAHPYHAGALTVLGAAQRRLGALAAAAACLDRARDIYESSRGPRYWSLAEVLDELAALHLARGEADPAAALRGRAAEIRATAGPTARP